MSDHERRAGDTFGREDRSYRDEPEEFSHREASEDLTYRDEPEDLTGGDYDGDVGANRTSGVGRSTAERELAGDGTALFDPDAVDRFRRRWADIQASFVDEPRHAVEEADQLVGDVTDRLSEMFASSRDDLERRWSAGEEASTEDLRQALRQYRSFFDRLLSV